MALTLQELYNKVTEHMTPEQALKKILKENLAMYSRNKNDNDGDKIYPSILIAIASVEMGWDITVSENEKGDEVNGMIIGTKEYISMIINRLKQDDLFNILSKN